MEIDIKEVIDTIDINKNDRRFAFVLDYRHDKEHFKILDTYKEQEVADNISVDTILKIISNIYSEFLEMDRNHLLYSYEIRKGYCNSDENQSFELCAMRPMSCGGTGILGLRIFILNDVVIDDKISNIKSPYKEILQNIKSKIHPYFFTFKGIINELNNKYDEYYYSVYEKNSEDLEWHYIDMSEFKDILLKEMKANRLFNNIVEDFEFNISDDKKKMTIINKITNYQFKLHQYSETKYFCSID